MSRSATKPVAVSLPPIAYQRAALRVIEECGVYNYQHEEFSAIVSDLRTRCEHCGEQEFERLMSDALRDDRLRDFALEAESAGNLAMGERTRAGYLLGLAVGMRIGGAR